MADYKNYTEEEILLLVENNDIEEIYSALANYSDPIPREQIIAFFQLHAALHLITWRARNYTDKNLETLTNIGKTRLALKYARLRRLSYERFEGLLVIWKNIGKPEILFQEMFEEIANIDSDYWIEMAIGSITEILSEYDYERAFSIIQATDSNEVKDSAYKQLAKSTIPHDVDRVLKLAALIQDKEKKIRILADISQELMAYDRKYGHQILQRAIQLANTLEDSWRKDWMLSYIAGSVSHFDVEYAFQITEKIQRESAKDVALQKIALIIAQTDVEQALQIIYSTREDTYDTRDRDDALWKMVKLICKYDVERALNIIKTMQHPKEKNHAKLDILSIVSQKDTIAALQLLLREDYEYLTYSGLQRIAIERSVSDIEGALQLTEHIMPVPLTLHHPKVQTLQDIAYDISKENSQIAGRILQESFEIQEKESYGLITDVDFLKHTACRVGLYNASYGRKIAEKIRWEWDRKRTLEAIEKKQLFPDRYTTYKSNEEIILEITGQTDLENAFTIAKDITKERERSRALSAIVKKMSETNIERAMEIAQLIDITDTQKVAFGAIAKKMSETNLEQSLEIADLIQDDNYHDQIYGSISLTALRIHNDFNYALKINQQIQKIHHRGKYLAELFRNIDYSYTTQALQIAHSIEDSESQQTAYANIAIAMSYHDVNQALQALEFMKFSKRIDVRPLCAIIEETTSPLKFSIELKGGEQENTDVRNIEIEHGS